MIINLEGSLQRIGVYYANVELDNTSLKLQVDTGSSSLLVTSKLPATKPVACGDSSLCGVGTCLSKDCEQGYCMPHSKACCVEKEGEGHPRCGFFLSFGEDMAGMRVVVYHALGW